MPLNVGSRLAHYDVTALIGEGGMGQVYQATDTKLNRQVALKILPEAFAQDPDRLARFQREAQVLASLNHPNIAQIHGLEESGDTRALVLELVEGPTLADRIAKGPIPLDEALPIAKQIAEALEAAHEAGVIHRDLKPANIKVRDDGTVKVLDFGLAKALDPTPEGDPSQSPTLTAAATQMGVIMGTASYMAPEQAVGKPVDKRADIWSFGVVLFEMLTGKRLFTGETVSHVLARILDREPDLGGLPTATPSSITRLLRRCLERERNERLPDVGAARLEIRDALLRVPEAEMPVPEVRRRAAVWATVVAIGAAALTSAVWYAQLDRTATQTPLVTRFQVPVDGGYHMLFGEGPRLALSPDGRTLVFGSQGQLHVKRLGTEQAVALEGTEGAESPFVSADGQWIGFVQDSGLRRVSIDGGAVIDISGTDEDVAEYAGATWGADGTIVYSGQTSRMLKRIPSAGGTAEPIVPIDPNSLVPTQSWPQLLNGGQQVLYTSIESGSWEDARIVLLDIATGEETTVVAPGTHARYVPSGHIVYATGTGTLLAIPFDLGRRQVIGDPVPVASGVGIASWGGGASFAVSDGGTLAFARDSPETRNELWWVDRQGQRVQQLGAPGSANYLNISPDGGRVVMDNDTPGGGRIWLVDVATGARDRLTFDDGYAFSPVWSPDGQQIGHIGYVPDEDTIQYVLLVRDTVGGADPVEIYRAKPNGSLWLLSWSPDGERLAFVESRDGLSDIFTMRTDGQDDPMPVATTDADEFFPQFSPNGRWLAYQSNQSGRNEVFVVSFPELQNKHQVSTEGGARPRWSRSGDELFFWTPDGTLIATSISADDTLQRGPPQVLFRMPEHSQLDTYDVSPDDDQFLVSVRSPDAVATEIHVVTNWTEELKRLVPVP